MGIRDSIDLDSAQRRLVNRLLDLHVRDMEVWAYGSRVRWTSHPASDLDLVVFVSEDQASRVSRLKEAFDESNLPFQVDVHIWDRLPSLFHEKITSNYMILRHAHCKSKSTSIATLPLGEFAPLTYGKSLPASQRNSDGNIPVYGSNGIVGYHDTALTEGPTIIIGRKGTVGAIHYSSKPCWPIDTTFYSEDSDDELMRFKYYALDSLQLDLMNSDSAVPGLNRSHAQSLELSIPSVQHQRTIAKILGTLDDKIAVLQETAHTLEKIARVLFKSWFIDFDPVRAKAKGREPQFPEHLAVLFPNRLVDSKVGRIPAGWTPISLPEAMEINPRRPLRKGELAPYLGMAGMPTLSHRPSRVGHQPFGSGSRFINGDTLVARITPCLENGKVAFVDFLSDKEVGWGSTEYIVMHSKPPLPRPFAYFLTRTTEFRDFAISAMTGSSGRQRVPVQALSDFRFPLPPASIAQAFDKIVDPLIKRSSIATESAATLTNLRDSLLPRLVSGSHQALLGTG